eukprot:1300928-Amphidinium_carterae.1
MGTSGSTFGAPCRTCDTDASGLRDVSLVVSNFPAAKDWLLAGHLASVIDRMPSHHFQLPAGRNHF